MSFRWTAKGLSHTYTCIRSPLNSPSVQAATWHWPEVLVLYRRSLLLIHFKHSRVYMSIPNSLTIPSPHKFCYIWCMQKTCITCKWCSIIIKCTHITYHTAIWLNWFSYWASSLPWNPGSRMESLSGMLWASFPPSFKAGSPHLYSFPNNTCWVQSDFEKY